MMTKKKNLLLIALTLVLMLEIILPAKVNATVAAKDSTTSTTYITLEEYIKNLVITTKLTVDNTMEQPYIFAALLGGLIMEGEFTDYSAFIIREDAALMANRADEILHGKNYNETLYGQIKQKKRIFDLKKVAKEKKDAVIKIFEKGIMVGKSKGMYTHNRDFCGKDKLERVEASVIITRLSKKSKRKTLSPDGQLIRTTKLPKNHKDYPYILAAFPNRFYEKRYHWPKDAISPVETLKRKLNGYKLRDVLDAYLDSWTNKLETNLHTRLNVNYKTVNNKWINTLAGTYYVYHAEELAYMNKRRTDDIKEYLADLKKNKVIVKGKCSVESSTLYDSYGFYFRACVKFKVVSAQKMKIHQEVMYGSDIYLDELEKNKWYTLYVDTNLGTVNGRSIGEDYAVVVDAMY